MLPAPLLGNQEVNVCVCEKLKKREGERKRKCACVSSFKAFKMLMQILGAVCDDHPLRIQCHTHTHSGWAPRECFASGEAL